jgi:flagellar motor protein MotB
MAWRRDEETPNYWPAVADVFIGFLAVVLIAGLTAYTVATGKGQEPPHAKKEFRRIFEEIFAHSPTFAQVSESERPRVDNEGFSELNIYFPAAFLFEPCGTDLMRPAVVELNDLKSLFNRFDKQILRVQITGHTDTDRPLPGGQCYKQGIRTNWELSARRAITVLELLAPDDGSGLDPRKVWAAALGEYHPVINGSDDEAKAKNRRIEVLVRFQETGP